MSCLISIDPGSVKCGLVLVDPQLGVVLDGRIATPKGVREIVLQWMRRTSVERLVLGNGTYSSQLHGILSELLPVLVIDERGTTLRARSRYYELWPPRNLMKWFPKGLLFPPNDLDAVAALVILEGYLDKKMSWPGPEKFKNEL